MIQFQDNIKYSHLKDQVWEDKLQSCLDTSKLGFVIYSAHTFQLNQIVKNILNMVEQENGQYTEVAIRSKVAYQMDEYRNFFTKI